jgi:RNA polymerase sigma-70 factor (ECF subfamily)
MNEPSDEELIRRAGQGDRLAYADLVRRHLGRVTGMAQRIMSSRADAEEIAQEAFMRVWTKAPNWQSAAAGAAGETPVGTAKFSTWLYRVVVNLCIDRKRRPRHRPMDESIDPPDLAPLAPDRIGSAQIGAHVAAAVARLPERQRTALTLCFFEELSNREAAEIMALTPGAVESLLVRARRALRTALAGMAADLLEV